MAVTRVLAKRGTAAQIAAVSSANQLAGEIAFATDTKDFYVSDGTQFNKITDLESNGNFYVSGNVGIGTTTPTSPLHVAGNLFVDGSSLKVVNNSVTNYYDSDRMNSYGTYYDWRFAGNTKMRITSAGNVGIGTTSPSKPLHVDSVNGARISYESANMDLFYYGIEFNRGSNYLRPTTNSDKNLYIGSANQNYAWNNVYLDSAIVDFRNSSSTLMRFDSSTGRLGIGTTSPSWKLDLNGGTENVLASFSSTDQTAQLRIVDGSNVPFFFGVIGTGAYITPTGATPADGISIKDTGNVGIGIASPTSRLEVLTSTNEEGIVLKDASANLKYKVRQFNGNTYSSFWNASNSETVRIHSSSSTYFNGGNVGIGTTSPATKIDVDGTGRITDTVYLSTNTNSKTGIGTTSPTHKLDVKGDISADEFLQAPSGIPRVNLGDPTVTEMALFESQMSCKTDLSDDYTDLTKVTFWQQPNEGDAWSQVTVSDDNKKKFLRTNNSSIVIPNGTYRYRIEFEPKSYRSAQAFYCYHSYRGNAFAVHVWKRRCSDNQWFQHTDSDVEVGKWPGHLYLPMDVIFWHPTDTTSTYRYNLIRIEFIPNWSASNTYNIDLYGGQLWGGYPAGKRTPHTYNHDGQLTLPANLIVPDDLIVNSGNVGIGTTSLTEKLHVNGNLRFMGSRFIGTTAGSDDLSIIPERDLKLGTQSSDNVYIGRDFTWSGKVVIQANAANTMVVTDNKVGIGTTSPQKLLDVNGDVRFKRNIYGADGNYIGFFTDGGSALPIKVASLTISNTYNDTAPNYGLYVKGNVGIGTTSPTTPLDVSGTITVRNSASLLRKYESTWANADTHDVVYQGWTSTMGDYVYLKAQGNSTGDHGMLIVGDNVAYIGGSNVETGAVTGLDQTWATFKNDGVGIGTTSPSAKLDLYKTASTSTDDRMLKIYRRGSTSNGVEVSGIDLELQRISWSNSNFIGGKFKVRSENRIGNGGFYGVYSHVEYDNDYSADASEVLDGELYAFYSKITTINTSGNHHADNAYGLFLESPDVGVNSKINKYVGVNIKAPTGSGTINTKYALVTEDGAGNVGIGTTAPTEKLHVAGNVKIEDLNPTIKLLDTNGADWDIELEDNHLRFKVGSTEYVRFQNGGNVGINNSAPNVKLTIGDSPSGPALGSLWVTSDLRIGVDSTYAWIQSHGSKPLALNPLGNNIGIGTTSPGARLQINGSTSDTTATALAVRNSSLTSLLSIRNDGRVDIPAGALVQSGGGYANTSTDSSYFTGNLGVGTTSPAAKLEIVHTDASKDTLVLGRTDNSSYWKVNHAGNDFRLYNRDSSGADILFGVDAGSITQNNRVGIGTATPSAKLDVAGDIKIGADQKIFSDGSITIGIDYNNNQTDRLFNIVANNTTEVFRVQEDGNVGIGTTNPYATLTVAGNITQTDNSYLISTRKITARGAEGLALYNDGGKGIDIKDNNGDVVIADGNVGIGTTNLSYKFNVNSGNAETVGFFKSTDSRARILISDDDTNTYVGSENGYGFFGGQASLSTANLVINSTNGNVGIGTINPPYKLTVQGSAYVYGGNLNIPNGTYGIVNAGNTSQKIYFPSLGNFAFENVNVGIGTTSPGRKLTVAGTDNLLFLDSSGNSYLTIDRSATDRRSALVFSTAGDGTSNIPNNINWALGTADSDEVGDGTGFFIGTNTAATSAKLFINSSGNVDLTGNLTVTKSSATIKAIETGGGDVRMTAGGATGYIGTYNNNSLQLVQNGSVALFVDTSRNVGIGTTSPTSALQVVGRTKTSELHASNGNAIYTNQGSVAVGTSQVDSSAILNIASTTKGVLFPRMTSAQRTAISSPATGLIVYQTDSTEGLYIYKSTGWVQII